MARKDLEKHFIRLEDRNSHRFMTAEILDSMEPNTTEDEIALELLSCIED